MTKYFDKEGKEVEAFSKEELESKNKETMDAYIKENPNVSADLKIAQDNLDAANKKIEEFGKGKEGDDDDDDDGDQQKKRLKQDKEEAETKLNDFMEKTNKEMKEFKDGIIGGSKTKVLDKLAGDDAELRAKIELHYDSFNGDLSNEIDVRDRLEKSFTLATGNAPKPGFMDGSASSSAKGEGFDNQKAGEETDNQKAMRDTFGISDADVEKYSDQINNANIKIT